MKVVRGSYVGQVANLRRIANPPAGSWRAAELPQATFESARIANPPAGMTRLLLAQPSLPVTFEAADSTGRWRSHRRPDHGVIRPASC
ncbi:MAG TPA: hypothetical protein VNY05_39845 [Candidatus Acidoferrales bacterium]|jgi:hypothetical protein|nr:hypothetical protein [Candidatus Acidoferrales bacterium]